jgi:hypothetical protein
MTLSLILRQIANTHCLPTLLTVVSRLCDVAFATGLDVEAGAASASLRPPTVRQSAAAAAHWLRASFPHSASHHYLRTSLRS